LHPSVSLVVSTSYPYPRVTVLCSTFVVGSTPSRVYAGIFLGSCYPWSLFFPSSSMRCTSLLFCGSLLHLFPFRFSPPLAVQNHTRRRRWLLLQHFLLRHIQLLCSSYSLSAIWILCFFPYLSRVFGSCVFSLLFSFHPRFSFIYALAVPLAAPLSFSVSHAVPAHPTIAVFLLQTLL